MRKFALRRWVAAAASLLAVVAVPVLAPTAAQASPDQCEQGKACFWSEPDSEGQFRAGDRPPAGSCYGIELPWADGTKSRARTVTNRTKRQIELFTNGAKCTGKPAKVIRSDQSDSDVSDSFGSFRVAPGCPEDTTCFYENADYTGKSWSARPEYYNRCQNAAGPGEVYARAAYNNRSSKATMFEGDYCINNYADFGAYEFKAIGFNSGAFKMTE